jgi:hypothetical protein
LAKYKAELPNDIIKQFLAVDKNTDKMLAEMTEAGAKVVVNNIKASVPKNWYTSNIMKCLKVTKTYKTPSDDGVNTKIAFYGYFINRNKWFVPCDKSFSYGCVDTMTEWRNGNPYFVKN